MGFLDEAGLRRLWDRVKGLVGIPIKRALTQAEYEALSEAEKTANVVYIITDDNGGVVENFNGRAGAVSPQEGDYSADMIDFSPGDTGMTARNVGDAVTELFISGSEGKTAVASAITAKGIETPADASFATLRNNILSIPTGINTDDATVTAEDILSGKTAYAQGERITGTIPLQDKLNVNVSVSPEGKIQADAEASMGYYPGTTGSQVLQLTTQPEKTFTPGKNDQTIKAGTYLTGQQTIQGDMNLRAGNIRAGVSIFNVAGTYIPLFDFEFIDHFYTDESRLTLTFTLPEHIEADEIVGIFANGGPGAWQDGGGPCLWAVRGDLWYGLVGTLSRELSIFEDTVTFNDDGTITMRIYESIDYTPTNYFAVYVLYR